MNMPPPTQKAVNSCPLINVGAVVRARRWMNAFAAIVFVFAVVSYLAIGLFLLAEQHCRSEAANFFSGLNAVCSFTVGTLLLALAYSVYCLVWEMRFSRDAVLFTTIATFFMISGADRSPVAFYLIVPFGAVLVVIILNIYAVEALEKANRKIPDCPLIRRLTEEDCETVLKYLAQEPIHTVFFTADIQDFGFDDPRFTLWGAVPNDPEDPASFEYVFCLYFDCLLIYSQKSTVDPDPLCRFILENKIEFQTLSGKESLVEPFAAFIPFGDRIHRCRLAELRPDDFKPFRNDSVEVEKATFRDAQEIFALRARMDEFRNILIPVEQLIDLLTTKKGQVFLIRQDGKIISSATETSATGRIGFVCTDMDYRGRGYASLLVSRLSEQALAEGRIPTLGYESESAGRIYQRLGYREVGRSAILTR